MIIKSFGGAKTVTGSCHFLKTDRSKFLVDFGLFQEKNSEQKNYELPFDPKTIDFVLLTHAHIDHSGRIPLLIKNGFRGKIYCTKPTYYLTRLMLLDTAKVMEENYKNSLKKLKKASNDIPIEPLYTEEEVIDSFDFFDPVLDYEKETQINDIKVVPKDAGHILGSSFFEIEAQGKKIIFSGDLGNKGKPIVNDFSYPTKADFVYMETTYADRDHKSFEESKKELLEAIIKTLEKDGIVLIPTYALERAQDILYVLREFYEENKLPKTKVFLDSPLSANITKVFLENPNYFRKETFEVFKKENPFYFPYLNVIKDVDESKKLNELMSGAIIIAGSGMLTGGRIIHHLLHHAYKENSAIIFVGYQPKGTLGRVILEGQNPVYIYHEPLVIRSKIYMINGFSSHAGQSELIEWLEKASPKKLFMIHGEEEKMNILKSKIKIDSYAPSFGEEIII